eukprot:5196253-Heterocapsa_arctica.AAC.1
MTTCSDDYMDGCRNLPEVLLCMYSMSVSAIFHVPNPHGRMPQSAGSDTKVTHKLIEVTHNMACAPGRSRSQW